jgi:hypothetical protein
MIDMMVFIVDLCFDRLFDQFLFELLKRGRRALIFFESAGGGGSLLGRITR